MTVVLSVFLMLVIWSAQAAVAGTTLAQAVEDLVAKVDARYASVLDFEADFIQETRIEGFDTPLRSSGKVFIKKPGLLRWDYREPSVEQIFVDGDRLQMYVPEHKQVVRGSLTKLAATKAPLQLLQGAGKLEEHFLVKPADNNQRGEGGLPLLKLIPKQHDPRHPSPVSHLVSEIHPETYFIQAVSLYEVSGNVSTFRFTNVKSNKGLPAAVFKIKVPNDVVYVDDVLPQ